MKKITILMLHLMHGGIERQTILFANELSKKYDVEIISVYSMKSNPAYKVDDNIKIKYLIDDKPNREEFKSNLKKFKLISTFKEGIKSIKILYNKNKLMIDEIKNLKCDYVVSTRIEFAYMLSKYAPNNVITITQEHLHNDSKKYIERVKKSFRNLDYLIVLGPGSYENYSKWLKDNKKIKIVEIPNIVESMPKEKSKLNGHTLLSIGRMHPVKGFTDLIDVFKLVREKVPDVKLNLLGNGVEYEKLKELSKGLNINMPGMLSIEEVKKYTLESDIYVMTSISECFPMVLLESSSYGLPLVAFDVPVGPKAIIKDNENGYLIKDRNKKEMAEKIIYLLNNKDIMKKMSKNSYENAKNYLPDKVMSKWYEIFDRK